MRLPGLMLMALCASTQATLAEAESLKVSLIVSSSYSKATVEAVRALKRDVSVMENVTIRVYPNTDIKAYDLQHLRQSNLVVIFRRGTSGFGPIKEDIRDVLKRGGRVYLVGTGTYSEEDQAMGILFDERLKKYFHGGGVNDITNGIRYALNGVGFRLAYQEPSDPPETGIYDRRTGRTFSNFQEYQKAYAAFRPGKPWVGVTFFTEDALSGNTKHIDALILHLEKNDFNVLPIFSQLSPESGPIEQFFFDEHGQGRVRAVIGVSMKFFPMPAVFEPLLTKLGVPVINAIELRSHSREEWERSAIGIDITSRTWKISNPEIDGLIQPTVFATEEHIKDETTGMMYEETRPIPDRVDRLVQRVKAWVRLQQKPNKEKVVAITYWNSRPGEEGIGASYLNVLPESLWQMYDRLRKENYNVGDSPITKEDLFESVICCARNIGNWDQKKIDQLAESGRATLIPIETYRAWFEQIPDVPRKKVLAQWGAPEDGKVMMWRSPEGKRYIVLPVVRYGNIIFTPQPARGWGQDGGKIYHDVTVTPHHQYIALYLWLQHSVSVDAVVSVGTHGSHEFLPGRDVGFSDEDFPELLIKDIPNIYPYHVEDVGEGIFAMRRGMALVIDHLPPPFDKAGLNPELKELSELINDFRLAQQKSPSLAEAKLAEINRLAAKIGILKDLGLQEIAMPAEELHDVSAQHDHMTGSGDPLHQLGHYILDMEEKLTPFGLHTFGVAPEPRYVRTTAEAIMSVEKSLSDEERTTRIQEIEALIQFSAKNELDSFVKALAGRYIPAGPGNDPIRNPSALPDRSKFLRVRSQQNPLERDV